MAKQTSKTQGTPASDWDNVPKAPPPMIVDGFFTFEEGNVIEGVVSGVGESKFGPYYGIRVKVPNSLGKGTTYSADKEFHEASDGQIIGVSDRAALVTLGDAVKAGPTAVRIVVVGKNGRAWDLDVRHRPAF